MPQRAHAFWMPVERVMCADVSSVVRTCQIFAQGGNTRERVWLYPRTPYCLRMYKF